MDEEALRDSLLIVLNGTFEWAGSEVFQRNGKTDITVHVPSGEGDPKSSFVAELKFWRGLAAFPRAIDQLLGYTLWRDSVCALVLLIANRDASAVISKAGELMVAHENCKHGSEPLAGEGSFVFQHPVDDSKELQVVLVPVVIPREVND